ncbi:MAG TPA: ROK family transcriptional regulator, partial [Burkholderiaceae bacterium]|nr:ROK family transcriptional regulator [Burkholderiaceae bacterium]
MTVRLQSRQLSQLHLYQVLHAVRVGRGAMSRAEIGERTGLSQPAVSSLTRRLLASGALTEGNPRPSQGGGRRERELMLNSEFAWVVGAKIAMHQVTITIADFAGGVATTVKRPLAAPLRLPELVRQLARDIDKALASAGRPVRQRLAGVGVAVPGFVDSLKGDVYWTPVLKAGTAHTPHPLAGALEQALGAPVFVENDANMLALAEQWFGDAGGVSHVAVVTLEHGLGLGLVLGDELYRGHRGLAAELGHVQIEAGGRACRCGKSGCLEAYVAHDAIVRQGQEAGLVAARGELPAAAIEAAYLELARTAHAGNARARKIFERQGRLLGQWIANMANLIAPQLVLVGGGPLIAIDLYEPALRAALEDGLALPH